MNRTPLAVTLLMLVTAKALATQPAVMPFQVHAAFFSAETKQTKVIDPQVFVPDASVQAATGPQGIKHVTGFRPAMIESDPATTPLSNADGKPLGFTLGAWLGASGTVTISPLKAGGETVSAQFHDLRPNAQYSLFENHFDQTPVGFTPLDGNGTNNSFQTDANGDASVTVIAPEVLTHSNAILVVYHGDGHTHGVSRGEIGIGAQHQLIARIPAD